MSIQIRILHRQAALARIQCARAAKRNRTLNRDPLPALRVATALASVIRIRGEIRRDERTYVTRNNDTALLPASPRGHCRQYSRCDERDQKQAGRGPDCSDVSGGMAIDDLKLRHKQQVKHAEDFIVLVNDHGAAGRRHRHKVTVGDFERAPICHANSKRTERLLVQHRTELFGAYVPNISRWQYISSGQFALADWGQYDETWPTQPGCVGLTSHSGSESVKPFSLV